MAQNSDVLLPAVRYTRSDFTALRAYLNRLPLHQISSLYYGEEDLEALACSNESALKLRLEQLLEQLIKRAGDDNPHLAELLRTARQSGTWSSRLASYLLQAGERDMSTPRPADQISAWFKPRMAKTLGVDQIRTLGDLVALIARRGTGWWKPIPSLGVGKARAIEGWLSRHAEVLGWLEPAPETAEAVPSQLLRPPAADLPVPMEYLILPEGLDGRLGRNRLQYLIIIRRIHCLKLK